jgi:tRNA uridine 5-carboxymethylaminomethyl modification enzyme
VYERFLEKKEKTEREIGRIRTTRIKPDRINAALLGLGTSAIKEDVTLEQILKRPEVSYSVIRRYAPSEEELPDEVGKQVEIEVKYEGYITRQRETAAKLSRLEEKHIPAAFDYRTLPGLSKELLCKLEEVRPSSLGQAGRIQGMTPAALSLIMIAMEKMKRG